MSYAGRCGNNLRSSYAGALLRSKRALRAGPPSLSCTHQLMPEAHRKLAQRGGRDREAHCQLEGSARTAVAACEVVLGALEQVCGSEGTLGPSACLDLAPRCTCGGGHGGQHSLGQTLAKASEKSVDIGGGVAHCCSSCAGRQAKYRVTTDRKHHWLALAKSICPVCRIGTQDVVGNSISCC